MGRARGYGGHERPAIHGCTTGQGYLFSRPIDHEPAEAFLESGANVFADNPSLEFRNPAPVIELSDVQ